MSRLEIYFYFLKESLNLNRSLLLKIFAYLESGKITHIFNAFEIMIKLLLSYQTYT